MARFRDRESPEQAYARQVAAGTDKTREELRKDARRFADRSRKVAEANPRGGKKTAAELAKVAADLRAKAKQVPAKPAPKPKRRWF